MVVLMVLMVLMVNLKLVHMFYVFERGRSAREVGVNGRYSHLT